MNIPEPSLEPLIALLSQAERERDTSLFDAQHAAQEEISAQAQAEQLLAYRLDYESRFREQFSRSSSITILQCYQGFIQRLCQAIEQQQQVAAQAAVRLECARGELRAKELRVASVRKLLERRLQELRQAADRIEQKQTDELAARMAAGHVSTHPLG